MTPGCGTSKKYFAFLVYIPVHLSFMHLLYTKLLLAEMLSPAPLPIPLLSELNQHPQMGEDTHPVPQLSKKEEHMTSSSKCGRHTADTVPEVTPTSIWSWGIN